MQRNLLTPMFLTAALFTTPALAWDARTPAPVDMPQFAKMASREGLRLQFGGKEFFKLKPSFSISIIQDKHDLDRASQYYLDSKFQNDLGGSKGYEMSPGVYFRQRGFKGTITIPFGPNR